MMRKMRESVFVAFLLALAVLIPCSQRAARSQIEFDEDDSKPENAKSADVVLEDMKELNNSFTIYETPDAKMLKAALKTAMEAQDSGLWDKAARQYYRIIDYSGTPLCYFHNLDERRIFIGLKGYCRKRISEFPPAGVKAFRDRYDRDIKTRLEGAIEALDENEIRKIALYYPISEYADDATWHIANILFEKEHFREAFLFYGRLLTRYPKSNIPAEQAWARAAACAGAVGPAAWGEMKALTEKALSPDLDKKIRTRDSESGKSIVITVRQYLEKTGGKAGLTLKSEKPFDPSGVSAFKMKWSLERVSSSQGYDTIVSGDRIYSSQMGDNPFDADNPEGRIKGFSLKTGRQVFLAQKYRTTRPAATDLPGYMFPATISADETAIYCIDINYAARHSKSRRGLGPQIWHYYTTELHAIDRETGKIIWSQPWEARNNGNPGGLDSKEEAEEVLDGICLTSSPVCSGPYLYVTAEKIGQENTEFYILCFNAKNGSLMWQRRIGIMATVGLATRMHSGGQLSVLGSKVAVSGGMVFFTSNIGVIGGADALTGDIHWIAQYHRPTDNQGRADTFPFIWYSSRPRICVEREITRDGKKSRANVLFVAPRDSDCVCAIDADTGKRIWERSIGRSITLNGGRNDRHWISFGEKYAVILRTAAEKPAEAARRPDSYVQPRLLVINLDTGKEANPQGRLPKDEELDNCEPLIDGGRLFLATKSAILCYDMKNNFRRVMEAQRDGSFPGINFHKMKVAGNRLIFIGRNAVRCFVPSGTE